MSLYHNPNMVTNGLVLCLDAGNTKSYPNTGTTWTDLSGNSNTGTLTNGPTFNSYEARTNGVANTTSGWGTLNCTLTPNSAVSPDGTTNATTITSTSTANSFAFPGTSSSSNTIYTVSIYAKQGTSPFVWVYDQYNIAGAWFNLSTGAVGSVSGSATASIVAAGNGWYRCIFTKDNTGFTPVANRLDIGLSDTAGSYSVTNGRTAYIYGVQREIGSFATSYIPTTSSPVTRSAGPATLVFDGLDDYATGTNASSVQITGNLTLSAWVVLGDSTYQGIISKMISNPYNGYGLVKVGGYFAFWTASGNAFTYTNSDITYTSNNNWFHVVGVRTAGVNRIFINGVRQIDSQSPSLSDSGAAFVIGRYYSDVNNFYAGGKIALASVYNTALTDAEVLQNFNALRGRFGI